MGQKASSKAKMIPKPSPPNLFPFCIVWCPIPIVTWLFPFVGHMGICLSSGEIMDFAGPFYVGLDSFAFGIPTRYLPLDPLHSGAVHSGDFDGSKAPSDVWDDALNVAAEDYRTRFYYFFTDNCHCFVARVLNVLGYAGGKKWDMVKLASIVFVKSRYVGLGGFLKTWLPFMILMGVGGYFFRLNLLYCYAIAFGVVMMWFLFCAYVLRRFTVGSREGIA